MGGCCESPNKSNNNSTKKLNNNGPNESNNNGPKIKIRYVQFEEIKTIKEHSSNVVSLYELNNKKIISGSYDKTIKLWNQNTFSCEQTIVEKNIIKCILEFVPGMLLIGSDSENIHLWDINSPHDIIFEFKGHLLAINCLVKCDDNFFASASNDADIRIWNYFKKECDKVLSGHDSNIFCLIKLKNNKLCSGSADKTIKIWNYIKNECEITLTEHNCWIKSLLESDDENILSGGDDGNIKIWHNYKPIKVLIGHNNSVKFLCKINKDYIASASFDNTIKIWNLNEYRCVQTLESHLDKVIYLLYHSNGFLISCSNDKTIKIWQHKLEKEKNK